MTLDVRIGKHVSWYEDGEKVDYVKECPPVDYDVCNPEFTLWSKEAYRSGSSSFWKFWRKYVGQLYYQMRRHPETNDFDFYPLKPIINEINKLPDSQLKDGIKVVDDFDFDRLKWFKFWSNRAVELYGDEAYISFS